MQTYKFGPKKGQPIPPRTEAEEAFYQFHRNCQKTFDIGGFTPISKFAKLTGKSTAELRQISEDIYGLVTSRYGRHGWIASQK